MGWEVREGDGMTSRLRWRGWTESTRKGKRTRCEVMGGKGREGGRGGKATTVICWKIWASQYKINVFDGLRHDTEFNNIHVYIYMYIHQLFFYIYEYCFSYFSVFVFFFVGVLRLDCKARIFQLDFRGALSSGMNWAFWSKLTSTFPPIAKKKKTLALHTMLQVR